MPTVREQIEYLEAEVKNLENRRSEVNRRAKEADVQAIGSTQQYDGWVKKAEEIIMESNTFIDKARNPNAKCLPKLWYDKPYQNRISQEAANHRRVVNNHYGEMQFDEAETRSTLENLSHQIEITSRHKLRGDILNYLRNDEVNTIGVYGTAGVGKTVMVERIIHQAENEKLFDVVVKATAPSDLNIMSIQNQIAEKMKVKFEAMKTIKQRADQLGHELLVKRNKKEKVLVILEDIGQHIGFAYEVVTPLKACCKLMITSRFKDILTGGPIEADQIFSLEALDDEEARDLFLKTLGVEGNSQLECLLEYCGGLPLAIVTIASALRDKNNYHWKYAVDLLKDCFGENTDGSYNRVSEIIELSFYYLQDKVAQQLLLFCCLYPKEMPIEVERLMGYCLGMHLFEVNCSLESAMVRLYESLTRLISCNFLSTMEDTDGIYYVQMSDAVRQVAIRIASREEYNFSVDSCWPMEEEQTSKHAISQCIKFKENENDGGNSGALEWHFENLEIFCLRYVSIEDKKIEPDGFFKRKEMVKVLDICCRCAGLDLNSQLHPLINLRSLRLIASNVKGLSEIGQLTNLEYLCIAVDSMKELPTTFKKLTQLQVLDLSRSGLLQIIPAEVIGSLSKLRGLSLNTRVTHSVIRILFPRINLLELKSCRHLKVLEAVLMVNGDPQGNHISEMEPILSHLLSFKLIISSNATRGKWGDGFDDIERKGLNKLFPRALHLHHINVSSPIKFHEMGSLWKNLQLLCCIKVEGLPEIQDKFPGLRVLLLSRCEDIKYLAKKNVKFAKLEFLVLQHLPNLEHICEQEEEGRWNGPLWKDRFRELREIYLEGLPKMKYNYAPYYFTGNTEYLFGGEDDLKSLELLSVTSLNCMKIWHFPVPADAFSRLRTIKIYKMPELRFLFPSPTLCTNLLQKVQTLDIRLCDKLETVIDEDETDFWPSNTEVVLKLEKMSLLTLPSLRCFFKGSRTLKFPDLQRVYLGHCPMMESFTAGGTTITPRLTDNKGVRIGDLDQLLKGKV